MGNLKTDIDLLPVSGRFLEGPDEKGSGRGNHLDAGLAVLDGQLHRHLCIILLLLLLLHTDFISSNNVDITRENNNNDGSTKTIKSNASGH